MYTSDAGFGYPNQPTRTGPSIYSAAFMTKR